MRRSRSGGMMHIAVLDVTKLTRVRETFRPGWRIITTLVFLAWTALFWMVNQGTPDLQSAAADPDVRASTLIVTAVTALVFGLMLTRTGVTAQLLFAAAAAFNALLIVLFTLWLLAFESGSDGPSMLWLGLALAALVWSWISFARGALASVRSVVPLPWGRPHRLRLSLSRRLWSGEWRGPDVPREPAFAGEPGAAEGTTRPRVGWGVAALGLGVTAWALAAIALFNGRFQTALYHLEVRQALHVLRTQPFYWDPDWPILEWEDTVFCVLALLGLVSVRSFSVAWEQWRRHGVRIYHTGIAHSMTPSGVLLLRSFREEEKGLPLQLRTWRTLPYVAYDRGYTFLTLTHERMAPVGPVHMAASETRPPPPHGNMHALPADAWEPDVRRAMSIARLIVVVFGTTPWLGSELDTLVADGFLEKTVFLLPHDTFPHQARRRWAALLERVCPDEEHRRTLAKRVKAQRVLAACVHPTRLVVLTGNQSQIAYESALDLATILILAPAAETRGMVTRYLKARRRLIPWPWPRAEPRHPPADAAV
jgi:hypothetical protein